MCSDFPHLSEDRRNRSVQTEVNIPHKDINDNTYKKRPFDRFLYLHNNSKEFGKSIQIQDVEAEKYEMYTMYIECFSAEDNAVGGYFLRTLILAFAIDTDGIIPCRYNLRLILYFIFLQFLSTELLCRIHTVLIVQCLYSFLPSIQIE